MDLNNLLKNYGSYTFNDEVMRERIPHSVYVAFHQSLKNGEPLTKETATVIANAMKIWALEKGATHFTHWFIPLNGVSSGKHDAFLELKDNTPLLEFSGKLLRKGEPDASSFPSGGLRATFEARGYTAWDCHSPAFIKDGSLYIPTLFCSYNGEALDNKTPLLKSCDCLNKQAVRLLKLLNYNVENVTSYVGSEQEYFLISDELYKKRLDLRFTGRTLFGANAPKGQEFDDHYFSTIKPKVAEFMKELDHELWKYGIPAKTKHNEAAPSQFEIACIYRDVNITTDNNHLLMELLKDLAPKYGLRCLLHEKPFKGINGSGKHNNWSVVTNDGLNLFAPGKQPFSNLPFLATLACLIKGVDEYASLLRVSIASASNDLRLGGYEAPPFVISMFLGNELTEIVNCLIEDRQINSFKKDRFKVGVSSIADFSKDDSDRNRTSPFAFTGNKFEFRGVGSSQSIALVNTFLNSILANSMKEMADLIEKGNSPISVIKNFINDHKRIIYNGDGYSLHWIKEANERGLNNTTNVVDAISCFDDNKIIKMLSELEIFTVEEIKSRQEIMYQTYYKTIVVEAKTALRMIRTQIYPSCLAYLKQLAELKISLINLNSEIAYFENDMNMVAEKLELLSQNCVILENYIDRAEKIKDIRMASLYALNEILKILNEIRGIVDRLEVLVDQKYWPIPTYCDLLFSE